MDGILLIDKPKGWTSFDVVAKVRGIIRTELRKSNPSLKNVKVGHTGTLDPAATGLLVLCIGKYTKKVEQMIRHDKTYEVELTLGATSTTGDQEGEITQIRNPKSEITKDEVRTALESFVGEQMQTPPAFSAIKVDGKRAYELARAGKEVKIEPRKITIHSIELGEFSYPILKFVCSVGSGTYIRSLVEDIGVKLGTGAYMSELLRTRVAEYTVEDALKTDELTLESIIKCLKA
jgi:tRNA pseudouridine55 synthase